MLRYILPKGIISLFLISLMSIALFLIYAYQAPVLKAHVFSEKPVRLHESNAPQFQTASISHTLFFPLILNKKQPSLFGVTTYAGSGSTYSSSVQKASELNASWMRIPVVWLNIEPVDTVPNQYSWSLHDERFLIAHNSNINIIATIYDNPIWAAEYRNGPVFAEHKADYLEFIQALVERYDGDGFDDAPGSPVVNYWEFYNEPDNTLTYKANEGIALWGCNAADYADMLSHAYPIVKSSNSNAQVVMGGLAQELFADENCQNGNFDPNFVDDFLNAGGGNYIDFFNFHYFPLFSSTWSAYGDDIVGKANFFRAKFAAHGYPNKPFVVTEVGKSSTFDSPNGGTEEDQARYIVQVFTRGMAADLRIMTWFNLYDFSAAYTTGLTYNDFAPKPGYLALQELISQLNEARFERTLTTAELGSTQAEGYAFTQNGQTLYIAWTVQPSQAASMRILANQVTQTNKEGQLTTIFDGSDGLVDGFVTVVYGASPSYIRWP